MPESSRPPSRHVKGALFVDYVRMLRANKGADWSPYLLPEDMSFLQQRIDPAGWYPMESFERMGLAILGEVARGDLETVRAFGQASIDWLLAKYPTLLAAGDPRDSIMRFQVLRSTFFGYPAVTLEAVSDGEATLRVAYGMGPKAEEAASWQTLGFFERLLEVSGAKEVEAWFASRAWAGDPETTIQLRWEA